MLKQKRGKEWAALLYALYDFEKRYFEKKNVKLELDFQRDVLEPYNEVLKKVQDPAIAFMVCFAYLDSFPLCAFDSKNAFNAFLLKNSRFKPLIEDVLSFLERKSLEIIKNPLKDVWFCEILNEFLMRFNYYVTPFFKDIPYCSLDGKSVISWGHFKKLVRTGERLIGRKTGYFNMSSGINHLYRLNGVSLYYAYQINGGKVYLDVPEFKGERGEPTWGFRSESERSCVVIRENEVIEQKGTRISRYIPSIHDTTFAPTGVNLLSTALEEHEIARKYINFLNYKTNVYDLKMEVKRPNPDNLNEFEKVKIGVLERKGNIENFSPHVRLRWLPFLFWYLSQEDIRMAMDKFGYVLGKMHNDSVFPLSLNRANVDIHGNPIDLEGTITREKFQELYKTWKLKTFEFLEENFNPYILNFSFAQTPVDVIGSRSLRGIDRKYYPMLMEIASKYGKIYFPPARKWCEYEKHFLRFEERAFEPTSLHICLDNVLHLEELIRLIKNVPKISLCEPFLSAYLEQRGLAFTQDLKEIQDPQRLTYKALEKIYGNDFPRIFIPIQFQFMNKSQVEEVLAPYKTSS